MAFLFELLPVLAFFVAYKFAGLYISTAIMMVFAVFQLGWNWLQGKRLSIIQVFSLALIGVMGGATLIFHNLWFIKWKPTLLYWLLALVCVLSAYFGRMTVAERVLGTVVTLPDIIWRQLNRYWALCFSGLGA